MNPLPGSHRRKVVAAAAILALTAAWLVYSSGGDKTFDWRLFRDTVAGLDWVWLASGLAAAFGAYLVRALRWAVLLEPVKAHPSLRQLLSSTLIGYAAVTALGRAAEMVRPYLIANRENVPFASQLAAWIVERIYDTLFSLAVFGFAVSEISGSGVRTGPALSWALRLGGVIIALGAAAGLALLLAMRYRGAHIQNWLLRSLGFLAKHHFERAERLTEAFLDGVSCTRSRTATLRMIAYTFVEWVLIAACYASVLNAFGGVLYPSWVTIAILMGFVSSGSLVQLPAVGGGTQVTAVLVLTQIFGVPLEAATGIGLVLWVVMFAGVLPVGVALAIHEGLTWAGLRQAERGSL